MDRDAFLARVSAAVEAVDDAAWSDPYTPGPLVPQLSRSDLVERFVERLTSIDGVVHRVDTRQDALALVLQLAATYDADSYLAWDDAELPIEGMSARLAEHGLDAVEVHDGADPSSKEQRWSAYESLRLGITGADAGLAETGSIVLAGGPGRPRMASLIPLVHIVLLQQDAIVPSLSHWVAQHPEGARSSANLVFITGPSRTADIEQRLNLGVHGPKHIHVIAIADTVP